MMIYPGQDVYWHDPDTSRSGRALVTGIAGDQITLELADNNGTVVTVRVSEIRQLEDEEFNF